MNAHPLTPTEYAIIVEIGRFLSHHNDGSPYVREMLGVLGCWGDSLPEEDVLSLMRSINAHDTPWRTAHPHAV